MPRSDSAVATGALFRLAWLVAAIAARFHRGLRARARDTASARRHAAGPPPSRAPVRFQRLAATSAPPGGNNAPAAFLLIPLALPLAGLAVTDAGRDGISRRR